MGRGVISKGEERIVLGKVTFPQEGELGSYPANYLIFIWGRERAHVADYFTEASQKIPLTVKTTFLEEVRSAVRLGIKPWFGDFA